jgi:fused signal recognition particle receptor
MFNFLKDKLKGVLSKFTKKVEEEAPEEKVSVEKEITVAPPKKKPEPKKEAKKEKPKAEKKPEVKREEPKVEAKPEVKAEEKVEAAPDIKVEEKVEVVEEKKGFFAKIKESFVGKEEPKVEAKPEVKVEEKVEVKREKEVVEEKKGFFQKITETITTKRISPERFDEMFWDLELALLENNVAVEVIEKIKIDLKSQLVDKPIPRGKVEETIASSLHVSIEDLFKVPQIDLLEKAKQKKPFVICFVGVNGSGKTTSIAKVANYLQSNGLSVVLAAADTFRAAAIDQLQLHADKLNVKLIRHDYGSDPAAVAFDAIKHAEAKKIDVVLIDTAGRLHSNVNLMDEMKKIMRVAKPDLKIFVGESITGNDCVEQAKQFNDSVGVDGIILSKADVDEKGGAAISVSYVTQKPILFLGVGQEYKDLQQFDKEKLLASIGL